MYRYTTPTLPVTIEGINFADVDKFRIAIQMPNKQILKEVPANDESVDPQTNTILLALTQEETAEMEVGYAKIQVRIRYTSGSVQATNKATVSIEDVYDRVII